ncbi:hypothetical protein ACFFQW_44685 [Umezawaea endophytica]|uniref:Small secreted domain DUF320 n=1 Tax=Umezawaea endophytica TaxID=1654476 RepID=A0A9X2VW07_9PSEU|nr:hypothetical protein [Umezawaea endophytica]MCS7483656.1 hypothetical protein [Umezawaea endophytica]
MRTRPTRLLGAALVALVIGAAGAIAGQGTAAAAEPVVVGSCSTTVEGAPGTPVALSPGAVVDPVVNLVRAIPLLGPPLADPLRQAFTSLPPIPIGAIPTGTGVITGGEIANKVVAELSKLPLLGPVIGVLGASVQQTLSATCGVTVKAVNAVVAPVQDGTSAIADASEGIVEQVVPGANQPQVPPGGQPGTGQPGTGTPGTGTGTTPGQPGPGSIFSPVGGVGPGDVPLYGPQGLGANFGRVPLFGYGSLPFATPGLFSPSPGVRYGGQVPGYAPGYGLPTTDTGTVQTAGRAQALPGTGKMGGVAAPVLLAVLALSCVTGALVRTWVLRRSAA